MDGPTGRRGGRSLTTASSSSDWSTSSDSDDTLPNRPVRIGLSTVVLVLLPIAYFGYSRLPASWHTRGFLHGQLVSFFHNGHIARYVRTHMPNVTKDSWSMTCQEHRPLPHSSASCSPQRLANDTGIERHSDEDVSFCVASVFGTPDSDGSPPQCRMHDVNNLQQEMGWGSAAVYDPSWKDHCSNVKELSDYIQYCDCLEGYNPDWFKTFTKNLQKYCKSKFLILIRKKDGDVSFPQMCELRWMIRQLGTELECPIIAWTFDQLWQFQNLICSAHHGETLGDSLEEVILAGGEQVSSLILDMKAEGESATWIPYYRQYLKFITSSHAHCWI